MGDVVSGYKGHLAQEAYVFVQVYEEAEWKTPGHDASQDQLGRSSRYVGSIMVTPESLR